MDNVTHAMIGITLGHAIVAQARPELRTRQWIHAAIWTAALGNNLPDIDFVITPLLQDKEVGYLLHHRGHSHTIFVAALLGWVSAWIGARLAGLRLREHPNLAVLGVLCGFAHVATDFWNDYGVHPFWPFSSRWFYGDFVFIVEPSLWMILLPFILLVSESRWLRGILGVLLLVMLGLVWLGPFMAWSVALTLTLLLGLNFWLQKRKPSPLLALGLVLLVLAAHATLSQVVRSRVEKVISAQAGATRTLDLVTTPSPGNPTCWRVIHVGQESGNYVVRSGTVSLLPSLQSPAICYFRQKEATELPRPYQKTTLAQDSMIHWQGEYSAPVEQFRDLALTRCRFYQLIRYARVPYWYPSGTGWIAGDFRYHHPGGGNFTEVEVEASQECLDWMPKWQPPRDELLSPAGAE